MSSESTETTRPARTRTPEPPPPTLRRTAGGQEVDVQAALTKAIGHLDKQYGLGTVMRLGDSTRLQVAAIPTGSARLDLATGVGGYPRGRVVEIYGQEASGKTTLALHAIASCQAQGGQAAFIDVEHALDPVYARKLGVRLDDLLVSQPDYGEQALEICEQLVSSGAVDLVVIDSVAALVPLAELEGDMSDQQMGLQARLMSKALRKITGTAHKNGTCVIFINQVRQKIGVTFGSGEVTTGGNALKFYSSLRLDVKRTGSIKEEGDAVGNATRVRVVKNKLAPPFRQVEFEIIFGKGIHRTGELVDLGVERGVIARNGSWYTFGEDKLGQGREAALEHFTNNAAAFERLQGLLLAPPAAAEA